jgi:hypothetical protein
MKGKRTMRRLSFGNGYSMSNTCSYNGSARAITSRAHCACPMYSCVAMRLIRTSFVVS